jgi:hypothetical protein
MLKNKSQELLQAAVDEFKKLAKDYAADLITRDDILEVDGEYWMRSWSLDDIFLTVMLSRAADTLFAAIDNLDAANADPATPEEEERKAMLRIFNGRPDEMYNDNIPLTFRWKYASAYSQSYQSTH